MKRTLPTFSVTGSLQDLIELEMVLIMLGYSKSNEGWNNWIIMKDSTMIKSIVCYCGLDIRYHFDVYPHILVTFDSSDISGIVAYVSGGE